MPKTEVFAGGMGIAHSKGGAGRGLYRGRLGVWEMKILARLLRGVLTGRAEPREWRAEMANTSQQAAVANKTEFENVPLEWSDFVGSKNVHLLQVLLDGRPFPEPVRGITYCLDVHENESALPAAVRYVRQARAARPGSVLRFTPSIFALVDIRDLTPDQLDLLNEELIPAGASIFEYPKGCKSFREAMYTLFEEVKESRRAYAEEQDRRSHRSGLRYKVRQALTRRDRLETSVKAAGQGASSGSLNASAAE